MASSVRPYSRYLPPPLSDFTGTLNVLTQIPGCFCLLHSPHGCAEFYDDDLTAFAFESDSVANVDLDQHSVIHGAEERVEQAILTVDRELGPRLIALVASPVSALIGTDLEGVARKVSGRIRAEIAVFGSGGIKGDWWEGEREVYAWFAREIVEPPAARASGVNLIGASYSVYNWRSDLREIRRILEGLGVPVVASFSIEATLDDIARAGAASLNLVLDAAGFEAARILEERFGLPYLAGLPFGLWGTEAWLARLGDLLGVDPAPFLRLERERFLPSLRRIADVEHDHLANRYETLTAAVMGNGFHAEGLARFLYADLGLEVDPLVLTNPGSDDRLESLIGHAAIRDCPHEDILLERLAASPPALAFGDSYFQRLVAHVSEKLPFVPIANPYLPSVGFYDDAPYLGYRGALYLTQTILGEINRAGCTHRRVRDRRSTGIKDSATSCGR